MIRRATLALALLAGPAAADVEAVIEAHVLPRTEAFADAAAQLAETDCAPDALSPAFAETAAAWAGMQHLALGPTIEQGRAQAVLFWPDDRDATRRGLQLLTAQGPDAWTPDAIARASVAARGLGALERLIFESEAEPCALTLALADDLAATAATIRDGWHGPFAETMRSAGAEGNTRFLSEEEAEAALYTALVTGIEQVAEARLGRPLGTFDAPRPLRAELRRSGLSGAMVVAALSGLRELASALHTAPETDAILARAIEEAKALPEGALAGTDDPLVRVRVEALQATVRSALSSAQDEIGVALGMRAGFNATDGD